MRWRVPVDWFVYDAILFIVWTLLFYFHDHFSGIAFGSNTVCRQYIENEFMSQIQLYTYIKFTILQEMPAKLLVGRPTWRGFIAAKFGEFGVTDMDKIHYEWIYAIYYTKCVIHYSIIW